MSFNSLSNCVSLLNASVSLLDESIRTLDDAANDLSRLKKVLTINKIYGLVPDLDLENAKQNIKNEVQPHIGEVILRVKKELNHLERRKLNLMGKRDLQKGRLDSALAATGNGKVITGSNSTDVRIVYNGQVSEEKLNRLNVLQNKRDRLKYSLSRQNLQRTRTRLSVIPKLHPDP